MKCKVGLVQMSVDDDKSVNLERARAAIERVSKAGAELVVLPEMFCVPYDTKLFPHYAEKEGGEAQQMLSSAARECGVWLVGGSICEEEDGRYYNTSYVYNSEGTFVTKHRKKHLFDIDIKGGQYFKESDILSPGEAITVFDSPWGKIGLGICFDIRFSKTAMTMVDEGATMLIYPAAFNPSTGPRHWELLFRARAMDGQCYALGVAPARNEAAGYVSYAHSMVVNPWAEVVCELGIEETEAIIELDMDKVHEVRAQIPLGRE